MGGIVVAARLVEFKAHFRPAWVVLHKVQKVAGDYPNYDYFFDFISIEIMVSKML